LLQTTPENVNWRMCVVCVTILAKRAGTVRTVVLVVVDLHGWRVNVRLERLEGVRQVGDRVGVGGSGHEGNCRGGGRRGRTLLENVAP
jgi:hypothetical protein